MNRTKLLGNSNAASKYRVSKQFDPDPYLPPALNLAAAILRRAIDDSRRLAKGLRPNRNECYNYNEDELEFFYNSRWCGTLLSITGMTGQELKEAAQI